MEGLTPCPENSRNPIFVPFLLIDDPLESEPDSLWSFSLEDELADVALHHQLSEEEELQIGRMLQRHLFFDVLSAFTSKRIRPIDFIRNEHVDIQSYEAWYQFNRWADRIFEHSWSDREAIHTRALKVLDFALKCIDDAEKRMETCHRPNGLVVTVLLSIRLLLVTIEDFQSTVLSIRDPLSYWTFLAFNTKRWKQLHWATLFRLWFISLYRCMAVHLSSVFYRKLLGEIKASRQSRMPHRHLPVNAGDVVLRPSAALLRDRLVDSGWCPIRVQHQCKTFTYAEVNFLTLLNTLKPSGISHTHRTQADGCTAHTIRPDAEYQTTHVGECYCALFHVRLESLAEILESGNYPVISIDTSCDPWKFDVVPYTPAITYVFISHVWSDGLGNLSENAIPKCQLCRLVKLIKAAVPKRPIYSALLTVLSPYRRQRPDYLSRDGQIYLWLDTLCIPCARNAAQTQSVGRLRNQAIERITPAVVNSAATIVLDAVFDNIPLENLSQLPAHILSSKWIQRIWTLEEGCLAKSCIFAIGETSYNPTTAVSGHPDVSRLQDYSFQKYPIARLWFLVYHILQESKRDAIHRGVFMLSRQDELRNFVDIWNGLTVRSASYPEDAVIVFAHLLDFRSSSVLEHDRQRRLPNLIRSCKQIPLSLLYNRGARVGSEYSPQDAWLPAELNGDQLISGSFLELSRNIPGSTELLLHRSSHKNGTLRIYTMHEIIQENTNAATFILCDHIGAQSYIVRHEGTAPDGSYQGLTQTIDQASCYVLDSDYENSSIRGYAARGFRANLVGRDVNGLVLRYACPVSAWTSSQWDFQSESQTSATLMIIGARLESEGSRVVLQHGRYPAQSTTKNLTTCLEPCSC